MRAAREDGRENNMLRAIEWSKASIATEVSVLWLSHIRGRYVDVGKLVTSQSPLFSVNSIETDKASSLASLGRSQS